MRLLTPVMLWIGARPQCPHGVGIPSNSSVSRHGALAACAMLQSMNSSDPPADPTHRLALETAIAALQAQRAVLGDALVDAALAPLQERLAAAAQPVRHLRQVSVLFLDLVGSTQLIQHLDPEEVQAVVDGALATLAGVVKAHSGEVLRYTGDSLKAAFGARTTREDDAERAVLCGLELLQATAGLRHGLSGQDQAPLSARVGIHTGPVVRGGGVENDNSLSGLAVIIAARMEQTAPAGALRIGVVVLFVQIGALWLEAQHPCGFPAVATPAR